MVARKRRIYYREPVFRPPSEAYSLLIQATEGCTFKCSFCISNLSKQFLIRSFEDICVDLDIAAEDYGQSVRRIFLLDGNAFVMPTDLIVNICNYAKKKFPNLERVGAYAHAKDILKKSKEELRQISDAGFKIAYVGIETGDDALLKTIGKHVTGDEMVQAAHMLHEADIMFSGTIILGLAGNDKNASKNHAIATADVVNRMCPAKPQTWYISALTLMIPPGTPIFDQTKDGKFKPMNSQEILEELKMIIENIDEKVHSCIWRSNHASNYLPIKGTLAQDKQSILQQIEYAMKNPSKLRPEFFRGL